MPRRYRRTTLQLFEQMNIPVLEFPQGEGPPVYVSLPSGNWTGLGLGVGARIPFEKGGGGAMAFGLVRSKAVVWVYFGEGPGAAYCHHAPPGPLNLMVHEEALRQVECPQGRHDELYVVIASPGEVEERDEHFFLAQGVRPERILTYSHCFIPQFGVAETGCVGEAR